MKSERQGKREDGDKGSQIHDGALALPESRSPVLALSPSPLLPFSLSPVHPFSPSPLLALLLLATAANSLPAQGTLWDRRDLSTANLFYDYRARKVGDV